MSNQPVILIKRLEDVSAMLRNQLLRLTLGHSGRMHENVSEYGSEISPTVNAKVFYIVENRRVLSWGMVFNARTQKYRLRRPPILVEGHLITHQFNGWYTSKANSVDLFTAKAHRGKGYGSAIVKAMQNEYAGSILRGVLKRTTIYCRHGLRSDLND